MEIRLNKLISDSGLCSRREADKFIEEGRVTVNGRLPHVGQKVTEADIVLLDDVQVKTGKHTGHPSGRPAATQRLVSSPKSAALRKTSRNNPLNKARRAAARNKPKGE